MPFYGESYGLDLKANPAGEPARFHFDGLSLTLDSGDDPLILGATPDPVELADGDEAVVSWVIETGPGSGGTFTLTSGMDPDWSATPSVVTEPVGTFTVAGARTVVSSPTSITAADLLAEVNEPTVRIAVTAGSIEVVQVKLRVWPPAGAGGAWARGLDWVRTDTFVERWYASLSDGTEQLPTYEQAWVALKEKIVTWDGRPGWEYGPNPGGQSVRSFFYVVRDVGTAPFTPVATGGASVAVLAAHPGSPAPEPSLNAGTDPNEIRQEPRARIRNLGGTGVASAMFMQWDAASTLTVTAARVASETLGGPPLLTAHPTNPALRVGPFYHPTTFAPFEGVIPLTHLGIGQYAALSIMADEYFDGPPSGDVYSSTGGDLSGILPFLTAIYNYEFYDPTAVPVPPTPDREPRFFVVYEGEDRAVGFGKPDTEVAVFGVQTALGNYRDLTFAEYVDAGDPLPDFTP